MGGWLTGLAAEVAPMGKPVGLSCLEHERRERENYIYRRLCVQ
jgi:hypothetical protein